MLIDLLFRQSTKEQPPRSKERTDAIYAFFRVEKKRKPRKPRY